MTTTNKLKKLIKNGIEYLLDFVDLSSNQNVDWVKTFLQSPIVPTPTNNTDACTKKYVDDKFADLMALGKFLSLWNCSSWQPISFPLSTPYTYHTWDYFMVETLATSGNDSLMPNGSSYTWSASQTPDTTNEVKKWDFYIYDWTVRLYASNHWKDVSFSNIAWQPTDNQNLATALWNKQDTLVNQTNIKSVNNNSLLGSWNLVLDTVPSWWTQWQVVTKLSVGYGWANPAWWDVQVSTQANNIFTTWMKIWGGTQSNYQSLTPDSNTAYLILADQPTPPPTPRTPWVNTLAYYPLDSINTLNDMKWSWTAYNLINTGSVTFGVNAGVDCASFDGWVSSWLYNYSLSLGVPVAQTVLVWIYITRWDSSNYFQTIYRIWYTNNAQLWTWYNNNFNGGWPVLSLSQWWATESVASGSLLNQWHLLTNVSNWTSSIQYIDWVQYQTLTNTLSATQVGIYVWRASGTNDNLTWYLSNLIVEDKVWAPQEISDYFDATKSGYGIS